MLVPSEDNHENGGHEGGRHDQEFPRIFHDGGLGVHALVFTFGAGLFFSFFLGSGFGSLLVGFSLGESSAVDRSFFLLGFEHFGLGGVGRGGSGFGSRLSGGRIGRSGSGFSRSSGFSSRGSFGGRLVN